MIVDGVQTSTEPMQRTVQPTAKTTGRLRSMRIPTNDPTAKRGTSIKIVKRACARVRATKPTSCRSELRTWTLRTIQIKKHTIAATIPVTTCFIILMANVVLTVFDKGKRSAAFGKYGGATLLLASPLFLREVLDLVQPLEVLVLRPQDCLMFARSCENDAVRHWERVLKAQRRSGHGPLRCQIN